MRLCADQLVSGLQACQGFTDNILATCALHFDHFMLIPSPALETGIQSANEFQYKYMTHTICKSSVAAGRLGAYC